MASIFLSWIDLSGDILGIQNNLKIRRSAPISRPHSCASKVKPHLVAAAVFKVRKFGPGILGGLSWPRDLFWF